MPGTRAPRGLNNHPSPRILANARVSILALLLTELGFLLVSVGGGGAWGWWGWWGVGRGGGAALPLLNRHARECRQGQGRKEGPRSSREPRETPRARETPQELQTQHKVTTRRNEQLVWMNAEERSSAQNEPVRSLRRGTFLEMLCVRWMEVPHIFISCSKAQHRSTHTRFRVPAQDGQTKCGNQGVSAERRCVKQRAALAPCRCSLVAPRDSPRFVSHP